LLRLDVKERVLEAIAELPEREAAEITSALESIPATFGHPHVHRGLGIRQLRPGIYEARIGLGLRAIFTREGGWLRVQLIGNHNDVRRWLKS
jgi:hypothetical protein